LGHAYLCVLLLCTSLCLCLIHRTPNASHPACTASIPPSLRARKSSLPERRAHARLYTQVLGISTQFRCDLHRFRRLQCKSGEQSVPTGSWQSKNHQVRAVTKPRILASRPCVLAPLCTHAHRYILTLTLNCPHALGKTASSTMCLNLAFWPRYHDRGARNRRRHDSGYSGSRVSSMTVWG
jgi:hypothetical protein